MTVLDRLRAGDPRTARHAILGGALVVVLAGAAVAAFVHPAVALAAVVAIGVAPLIVRDIDRAFVAVVAVIMLLPFAAIPLGIGFNPTFLDLALGALYLIWLMRLVTREETRIHRPPLSAGVLLFMGLMVAAFLAGMAHGTPSRNQMRVFGEMLLGVGLFFVVGNLIESWSGLRRVFLAIVGLGFASALVGLGLYLLPNNWQVELLSLLRVLDYPSGPGVLRFLNDDPARLQRATGTSIDPNSFGGMLAMVTALLLPQVISRAPIIPRRPALAMVAVMLAALLATVSRGSLLGFAAGLAVIGLLRDRRLLAAGVAVGLALLALAYVMPWTAAYVEHFTAGLQNQDRATQMRMGEYRDALDLIQRYPVFGVGFGDPGDIDLYRGVSSFYLIITETMGLVGLSAFLILLGAVLARLAWAWRRMAGQEGVRAVVLGCLAGLATVVVSGVFDHYFFTYPHAFALLWLVIGLGMRATEFGSDSDAA
jgi:hypothetical protein